MTDDRTTKFLARWIPVAVVSDLCLAVISQAGAWPTEIAYVALGLTLVGTIIAAVAYLGSARGIQSVEDVGFQSYHEWLAYTLGWRGMRGRGIVLVLSTVIVTACTGWSQTSSGFLSFFTLPLAFVYQAVTRRYPLR